MGTRITAPTEFDGVQTYGVTVIPFVKGVAEVESLPAGVELYMLGAGYQLDKTEPEPPEPKDSDGEKVDGASTQPAADPATDPKDSPAADAQAEPAPARNRK